ncbi:uncharacterized protein LOC8079546 isoform X2 [Sorghum bicolor]|uniref:Uncharacterized protein n=1 Tax=Sorghum bicolor TaxID=4558 RepID=A0A1Z5RFQ0_SORBI|nr:uncharacterized protein LOC8079546 isoform X2 [Sorghum bicolor]OQU82409.1 hypothetical protein SORBI_3006G232900 [Sorghum bicolor]|eukprot:XP_021318508.1 uncharacterized protein LOC8079546 isoform X2 [Sorghum bicolor]
MQLRSGRRLVYPPPEQQGGGHRRRSQQSLEDRISSLPEDLLLEILVRLRSVAEAACAGAVSRGWRDLWTELPELTFWCANPLTVVSALAGITRSSVDLLDINLSSSWMEEDWGGDVSLLLLCAALVLPEKLIVSVMIHPTIEYAVELPCFECTSYLGLELMGSLPITLPQSGEFTALKNLHLQSCCIDLGALLLLCPCLRILNILNVSDLKHADTVIVHSPSLEELSLEITTHDICRIDIATPVLKEIWSLVSIKERKLDEFHVVSLIIMSSDNSNGLLDAEWSITQLIVHLPVTVFTVLELDLDIEGHTFGPMMLCLLRTQPIMQRLKVDLRRDKVRVSCPVNCPCEHPINWKSEDVSLSNLEVVEIHGLQGEDDEVDFLKIILRCATGLRRLTMTISDDISPSNNGYDKIRSIIKEYPDVEFHIIASGLRGFFILE